MGKRKQHEFDLAYELYVHKGLTAKDTALQVGISPQTMSNWIAKNNWKELRIAVQSGNAKLLKNLTELLSRLTEKRLEQERKGEEIDRNLINEIRNVGKQIDELKKESLPSLRTYVAVVSNFMNDLKEYDADLYFKLIEFQKYHFTKLKNII